MSAGIISLKCLGNKLYIYIYQREINRDAEANYVESGYRTARSNKNQGHKKYFLLLIKQAHSVDLITYSANTLLLLLLLLLPQLVSVWAEIFPNF